jgi:hypothetical protein
MPQSDLSEVAGLKKALARGASCFDANRRLGRQEELERAIELLFSAVD